MVFFQDDKLKWWPIYNDPMHEPVGRVQLHITYTTTQNESSHPKVTFGAYGQLTL